MVRAKLTSKGQITLPVGLRRHFGLKPGDEIAFRVDGSGARIMPLRKRRPSELRGILPARRSYPGKEVLRREIGLMLGAELERKIHRLKRSRRRVS